MIELTEKELALGRRLAHVDKSVRDRAVAAIGQVLEQSGELTHMELLRHWKALFYCFWLSDKPLVQQELSLSLASLTLACKDNNSVGFARAFWETLCREWFDVDKHRVDKYLLLARRMVFYGFQSMKQSNWDERVVESFLGAYQEGPINPTEQRIPNSIRSHMADVYVDELVRLAGEIRRGTQDAPEEEVAKIPVAVLLEPFMRLIGTTSIRQMPAIVQESVFEELVVRIAEAEERRNEQDSSSDGESDTNNNSLTDNQIVNESLGDVQFLVDSIPEIKQRLLSVGGEKTTNPSGRKRLHMLYQALCETFPDEETDIVFPKQIVVKSPIGAQKRKLLEKRRRKKAGKQPELKERRKSKPRVTQNIVAAPTAGFEANALEVAATAEDELKFQQDIVKIRAMEKRAGFGTTEDSGDASSAPPTSKKNKRKEKKSQPDGTHKGDKVPVRISSRAAESSTKFNSDNTANEERHSQQQGLWVVRSTDGTPTTKSSETRQWTGEPVSRLAEFEKTIIVRDKSAAVGNIEQTNGARLTPSSRTLAGGGSAVSGKKRQSWAMERNSVKRFLKKVPMLPSLEPVPVPEAQDVKLKPILRKRSAYGSEPAKLQRPLLKPLVPKSTKRKSQVFIGHHSSSSPSASGASSATIKF
ncbi:Nop52-domain-containing protein [Coemansia reversa NRRL 1564]|uniref:Nop52-domain-containing protein n=1 Tax=Coemansia reversa (strain ATCC 12441 / NRRL 1564) TaxID=763665 RepID=A0A2G5B614_COERN|nr:Nop52-domain-containing protein [Coemansia reversa NRRL 1564]|eukprot:PIA14432.1 Nop52-domain-containing protein [Coemansia reversa NRRL 1564]